MYDALYISDIWTAFRRRHTRPLRLATLRDGLQGIMLGGRDAGPS